MGTPAGIGISGRFGPKNVAVRICVAIECSASALLRWSLIERDRLRGRFGEGLSFARTRLKVRKAIVCVASRLMFCWFEHK